MYVGRFVVVAPGIGAYRVSSRSFPNRRVTDRDGRLTVGPTPDAPETDNPYVSYNCARGSARPPTSRWRSSATARTSTRSRRSSNSGTPPATRWRRHCSRSTSRRTTTTPPDRRRGRRRDRDDRGRPPRRPRRRGRRRAHHRRHLRDGQPRALRSRSRGRRKTPDAAAAATEVLGADFEHPVCAAGATVDADGATLAFDNDAE